MIMSLDRADDKTIYLLSIEIVLSALDYVPLVAYERIIATHCKFTPYLRDLIKLKYFYNFIYTLHIEIIYKLF